MGAEVPFGESLIDDTSSWVSPMSFVVVFGGAEKVVHMCISMLMSYA